MVGCSIGWCNGALVVFVYLKPIIWVKLLASLEPREGWLLPRGELVLSLQQRKHVLRIYDKKIIYT